MPRARPSATDSTPCSDMGAHSCRRVLALQGCSLRCSVEIGAWLRRWPRTHGCPSSRRSTPAKCWWLTFDSALSAGVIAEEGTRGSRSDQGARSTTTYARADDSFGVKASCWPRSREITPAVSTTSLKSGAMVPPRRTGGGARGCRAKSSAVDSVRPTTGIASTPSCFVTATVKRRWRSQPCRGANATTPSMMMDCRVAGAADHVLERL